MSGIEVVALVTGIVSAFAGATTVYQKWRQERRGRRKEEANKQLEQLVRTSGPTIQDRYNDDFRRLGQAFARGDEIGRIALMEQLVTLQQTVITLITSDGGANTVFRRLIHPNHDGILRTSSSVRDSTLSALTDQFQRLLQSLPIERPTDMTGQLQLGSRNPTVNCPTPLFGRTVDGNIRCGTCQWYMSKAQREILFGVEQPYRARARITKTKDGLEHDEYCMHRLFHYLESGRSIYCCTLCRPSIVLSLTEAVAHFASVHTWDELCGTFCRENTLTCAWHLNRSRNKSTSGTAIYAYEPLIWSELKVPAGARITQITGSNNNWLLGTYGGVRGWVPVPYVRLDS